MGGAAFFDLDRTLLAGASGPVLSKALRTAGVLSRDVPLEGLVYGIFNAYGETLPAIAAARHAATLAKGHSRAAVQAAATGAASSLLDSVQPFAGPLIERHRAAGQPVVLATTTPYDLVEPFAEMLGLDGLLATRYGVNGDGTYDGTIDGPFVWSTGKLDAVRDWSKANAISLKESYAYSDSVYDAPLLAAVGHPHVVNPDPRLIALAAARRWPTLHLDVPPGVQKVPLLGIEVQKLALQLARPSSFPFARFRIEGDGRLPREGGAIIAGNHRSYFDVAAMSVLVARTGRTVRFLGKKEVFDAPVIGPIAKAFGGIRVERGSGSDEPLRAAADALQAGELVAIMPQGTIPRGREFFDPKLKGRPGTARLAAMAKVPVIPVGLWGTEKVWPRSAKVPNVLNVLAPPTVMIRVGEPVELKYRSAEADTKRIMAAVMDLLPPEARQPHEPTADEIRRASP
jgi:putative phosphoserine phosphatase/1-acylglycerol-3-phosphate O-acyltransferase